jgi:hypothetical protein
MRMFFLASGSQSGKRRLIGTGLLLFVFFLPLHSHLSAPAQVTKECSCVHGSRTQMGLGPVQISAAPALLSSLLVTKEPTLVALRFVNLRAIRAPPHIASL